MRTKLDQDRFCEQFVASFCGAWCAKHYEDACMMGEHDKLESPPIEDAVFLADTAWAAYVEKVAIYEEDNKIDKLEEQNKKLKTKLKKLQDAARVVVESDRVFIGPNPLIMRLGEVLEEEQ